MSEETIDRLIAEAEALEWANPAKLVLGEQAVRVADRLQEPELQFLARTHLIEYATGCGAIDKAIVACAWCASHPELIEQAGHYVRYQFLWNYKHILHGAFQLPSITRDKIAEILNQMSIVHQQYGYNQRATEYLRFVNEMNMGRLELADVASSQFMEIPRDPMADCEACETNTRVELLALMHRDELALKTAQPLLRGEKKCVEVPHATYCRLLQPSLRQGAIEQADEFNRAGYAKIRANRFLLKEAAIHIGFDVYRRKLARALSRFERQLPTVVKSVELVEKFYFFTVGAQLMETLAETGSVCKLKIPPDFEWYDPADNYDPTELAAWFDSRANALGQQFDQRNGNDYFLGRLRSELRFETIG